VAGDKPHVTIIIPTLNEERGIREVLQRIPRRELGNPEVLVIDGGSSDGTVEVAKSLGADVILQTRSGYGQAILEGFHRASGDIVVVIDGDGVYDPIEIPKLMKTMESVNADMASGSRYIGVVKPRSLSFPKSLGDRLLNRMANLLFEMDFTDLYSGFRVLRRSLIEKISDRLQDPVQYSMVLSSRMCQAKIVEVPITFYSRLGVSKVSSIYSGARIVKLILKESVRWFHER
jgi:glycosyltransferase involved in cell wall biosynthesis